MRFKAHACDLIMCLKNQTPQKSSSTNNVAKKLVINIQSKHWYFFEINIFSLILNMDT